MWNNIAKRAINQPKTTAFFHNKKGAEPTERRRKENSTISRPNFTTYLQNFESNFYDKKEAEFWERWPNNFVVYP